MSHSIPADLPMFAGNSGDARDLYLSALDLMPGFVFVKNTEGQYTYVNKLFASYYLKIPDEMIGLRDDELNIPIDESLRYQEEDNWVMEHKQIKESQVFTIINPHGLERKIKTIKKPILNIEGEVKLIIGISQDLTDIIEAERQKLFAQNQYVRLFQNSLDPVLVINVPDNLLIDINEEGRNFFTQTDIQWLSRNPIGFFQQRFDQESGVPLTLVPSLGQMQERQEVRYKIEQDGGEFYHTLELRKFYLDPLDKRNCALVFRDLTHTIQAIEELKNSREYVKVLFDHAPDGILVLDLASGFILDCNAKAEELLGLERNYLINLIPEEIGMDDAETGKTPVKFWKDISKEIHEKGKLSFEWTMRHSSNGAFPVEINLVRLPGYQHMYQMSFYDISERKLAEQALKESEEKFRNLYEFAPTGIVITDEDLNILYANPAATLLLGYEESELKHMKVQDITHAEDMIHNLAMAESAKQGVDQYTLKKRYYRKDGSLIHVEVSVAVVRFLNGIIKYKIGHILDMTESVERRKKLVDQNEELKKVNQELNNLVYRTSHDLRAPIVSLLGLSDLIKESEDIEERQNMLAMMKGQLHKLDKVIQDIIDYRKVSLVDLKFESVDVTQLADEVIESIRFSKQIPHIRIVKQFQLPGDIITDPYPLRVILNNLISNAVKYSDHEKEFPEIYIAAVYKNDSLEIVVKDNGIGIEPDYQTKVFDMFFRGTEKSTGTGLGLYIVNWAVTRLGGEVQLQSIPKQGTEFKVRLPAQIA